MLPTPAMQHLAHPDGTPFYYDFEGGKECEAPEDQQILIKDPAPALLRQCGLVPVPPTQAGDLGSIRLRLLGQRVPSYYNGSSVHNLSEASVPIARP